MNPLETGRLVASVLTRSWRLEPPELTLTAGELAEVAPILARTGAGGLGWWRVRRSALRDEPAGAALKGLFGRQTFLAGLYELSVREALERLSSAGIDAVVVKGIGVAQLYSSAGMRRSGDIDVVVAPSQREAAARALEGRRYGQFDVDLCHDEYETLAPGDFAAVLAGCETIDVAGVPARVPCAEDRLRYLCVHFLRHYGYRPLWLCDIAVALEALPDGFDWGRCPGLGERSASWVRTAAGLACGLLGAEPRGDAPKFDEPPDWVAVEVLRLWGAGIVKAYHPCPAESSMRSVLGAASLRHPLGPLRAIRARWPNAFEFTVDTRRPFARRRPVLPRVGEGLRRAAGLLAADPGPRPGAPR